MSNTNKDILRSVWDGKVPVAFHLAAHDLAGATNRDPFFALVYRCSYLPYYSKELREWFGTANNGGGNNNNNNGNGDELWFEANNVPLKWQIPLGTLFDLYASTSELPWQVTVHIRSFPTDKLMRCGGEEDVKSVFFNTIKQTEQIRMGSTKRVMSLPTIDQNNLWQGFWTHNFDKFWSINSTFLTSDVKYIPFRIHSRDQPTIQQLIPTSIEGKETTLWNLMVQCGVVSSSAEGATSDSWGSLKVLVQGVSPLPSTPLLWLSDHLSIPDNFINVVVHRNASPL